ncbi:glycosyltransferase [Fibrobacter sp. HC4]|uniref:glycosyltransferase n=1 Tax=Fibrobacter sp. HC4 TaxID=3239812 RepID=UPI00201A050E|nr:glycosyltransferase [Fibrobacter succinogenes]MCL4103469.1 hypothetical protein [Fibrobacter succinogenes]
MKVNVYLSYYNGSKYFNEQIESLLNQKGVDVHVFVRNDGSNEFESAYLDNFKNHDRITVIHGKNVGFGKSFMQLISEVDEKADFYAFCDQDDVWLDNKLQTACEKIKAQSGPVAYCSQPKYVDADLKQLDGFGTVTDSIRFGVMGVDEALEYQLFGLGCTYVWNDALNGILKKIDLKNFVFAHDNFLSVLTPFVGTFYRDDCQLLLYRQHGKNVSGSKNKNSSLLSRIQKKWKNFNGQAGFAMRKFIAENAGCFIQPDKLNVLRMSVGYRECVTLKLKLLKYMFFDNVGYKKKLKNLLMIVGNRY